MKLKELIPQQNILKKEIWKDIPGFEGYYQASTYGNIRSVERISYYENGKRYTKRHYQGVTLSIRNDGNDLSEYVTLCKDGERYEDTIYSIMSGTFESESQFSIKKKSISIPVRCIDDDLEFSSIKSASRYYKVSDKTIKRYCNSNNIDRQKIKKKFVIVNKS